MRTGLRASPISTPNCGEIVAEMAVAVALSEAGNHTSERCDPAPQINTLQRDAIVCPVSRTQKYCAPVECIKCTRSELASLALSLYVCEGV